MAESPVAVPVRASPSPSPLPFDEYTFCDSICFTRCLPRGVHCCRFDDVPFYCRVGFDCTDGNVCTSLQDPSVIENSVSHFILDRMLANDTSRFSSSEPSVPDLSMLRCRQGEVVCGEGCMPEDATCCSAEGFCPSGYTCGFKAGTQMCRLKSTGVNLPTVIPSSKNTPPVDTSIIVWASLAFGFGLIMFALASIILSRRRKIKNLATKRNEKQSPEANAQQEEFEAIIVPSPPPIVVEGRPYVMYPKMIPVLLSDFDPADPTPSVIYAHAVPLKPETESSGLPRSLSAIHIPVSALAKMDENRRKSYQNIMRESTKKSNTSDEYPNSDTASVTIKRDPIIRRGNHFEEGTVYNATDSLNRDEPFFVQETIHRGPPAYFAEDSMDRPYSAKDSDKSSETPNKSISSKTHLFSASDSLERTNNTTYFAQDSMNRDTSPRKSASSYFAQDSIPRKTGFYFPQDSDRSTPSPTKQSYLASDSLDRDPFISSDYEASDSLDRSPQDETVRRIIKQPEVVDHKPKSENQGFIAYDSMDRNRVFSAHDSDEDDSKHTPFESGYSAPFDSLKRG